MIIWCQNLIECIELCLSVLIPLWSPNKDYSPANSHPPGVFLGHIPPQPLFCHKSIYFLWLKRFSIWDWTFKYPFNLNLRPPAAIGTSADQTEIKRWINEDLRSKLGIPAVRFVLMWKIGLRRRQREWDERLGTGFWVHPCVFFYHIQCVQCLSHTVNNWPDLRTISELIYSFTEGPIMYLIFQI